MGHHSPSWLLVRGPGHDGFCADQLPISAILRTTAEKIKLVNQMIPASFSSSADSCSANQPATTTSKKTIHSQALCLLTGNLPSPALCRTLDFLARLHADVASAEQRSVLRVAVLLPAVWCSLFPNCLQSKHVRKLSEPRLGQLCARITHENPEADACRRETLRVEITPLSGPGSPCAWSVTKPIHVNLPCRTGFR